MELQTWKCRTCGRDVAIRLKQCPRCSNDSATSRPSLAVGASTSAMAPVVTVQVVPGMQPRRMFDMLSVSVAVKAVLDGSEETAAAWQHHAEARATAGNEATERALAQIRQQATSLGANIVLGVTVETRDLRIGDEEGVSVTVRGTPCLLQRMVPETAPPGATMANVANGLRAANATASLWSLLSEDQ